MHGSQLRPVFEGRPDDHVLLHRERWHGSGHRQLERHLVIAAVNDGVATGKIAPVLQAPLVALLTAQAAMNRGLYGTARSILLSFEALVRAARGGGIVPSYADLLVAWSSDLRAHLP